MGAAISIAGYRGERICEGVRNILTLFYWVITVFAES